MRGRAGRQCSQGWPELAGGATFPTLLQAKFVHPTHVATQEAARAITRHTPRRAHIACLRTRSAAELASSGHAPCRTVALVRCSHGCARSRRPSTCNQTSIKCACDAGESSASALMLPYSCSGVLDVLGSHGPAFRRQLVGMLLHALQAWLADRRKRCTGSSSLTHLRGIRVGQGQRCCGSGALNLDQPGRRLTEPLSRAPRSPRTRAVT